VLSACGDPSPTATQDEPQSSQANDSSFTNTYWKLEKLKGEAVSMGDTQSREQHIIFQSEDERLIGFAGCNSMFGTFTHDAVNDTSGDISITQLGATKMACPDNDMNEQVFLSSLSEVNAYEISGEILHLFDSEQNTLAQFSAVYL